jgi:prepilin peptidase CpaA
MTAVALSLGDMLAALYCLLFVACAITDFVWLRIPNLLVLSLVVLFLACPAVTGVPVNWVWHIVPAVLVLFCSALLFRAGKMGGGDVKLLAAAALWVGVDGMPTFLIGLGVAGFFVALLFVISWRLFDAPLMRLQAWPAARALVPQSLAQRGNIPYGIVIAVASIAAASKISFFA